MRGPLQMKLKFAIRTLGCKVNQYESEVLKENLERLGHSESSEKEADVIVINSCTFTRDADTGTRYLVRRSHKDNPTAKIFVTGCYVDQGPTLKRFQPRAMGRADVLRKRTSHITVMVGDKKEG